MLIIMIALWLRTLMIYYRKLRKHRNRQRQRHAHPFSLFLLSVVLFMKLTIDTISEANVKEPIWPVIMYFNPLNR